MKLYAVLLGGKLEGAHIEVHDVRFVLANSLKETYPQLKSQWFGSPDGLHIDAYIQLECVDGYRIELLETPTVTSGDKQLYFINAGAAIDEKFNEFHEYAFCVAASTGEVLKRSKKELLCGMKDWHRDNLFDIDTLVNISEQFESVTIKLTKTKKAIMSTPIACYRLVK
jgi:hypothetical protein